VQLGDSIAAGEGIAYGYLYNPVTHTWGSAVSNPNWETTDPACHRTPDAYGALVTADLGGKFTQLSCTGASYLNGITTPQVDKDTGKVVASVAQFGSSATDVNPAYTAAAPNVVLVTLGADDVKFSDIVVSCIRNPKYPTSKKAGPPEKAELGEDCIKGNAGNVFDEDYPAASKQISAHYAALVSNIDAQAEAAGQEPPKIVFTNYMDPFPPDLAPCNDSTHFLDKDQLLFLNTELGDMNADIAAAVDSIAATNPNVGLADISKALSGHTWCSSDPWDYGLSVFTWEDAMSYLISGNYTLAPFHPTAAGQASIAHDVLQTVDKLLGIPSNQPAITTMSGGTQASVYGVTAAKGETISGTASGFTPSDTVTATLDSGRPELRTFTADSGGTVDFSVVIPTDTSGGQHQLLLTGTTSAETAVLPIFISFAPTAPKFTADTPPTTATVGSEYYYPFDTYASPGVTYTLGGDTPSWLSIDQSGDVYGTPPPGTASFTYSVSATNGVGTGAKAGSFTVTVKPATSQPHRPD
jgi:lysophospholipase L1-like esterase